jgi:DNA primase
MSGLFSPTTLEQVRAANDIVDIIGAVLPLKRAGASFVALCPFHKEKTPSFHVNPQRQIFHCFGCHKGGDVFRFVQDYENLSFPEAVRRLAERARIPLELNPDDGSRERRSAKERLLELHEAIAQRWHAVLATDAAGQTARDYLDRRGVGAEAIELFRLGAAPDAWDDTVNWARAKRYDLQLIEQAGLVVRKEGSDHYYDRFRGRLMFPINDEQGRVIAFSGRILTGDEKTAKYVNSPETPIFTKGRILYGLDKAKRAILDAGSVIVCEGQLDLIACHLAGIRNSVAPQGTALTADHARILRRYCEEVVLCFDSDTAGQNAAIRALEDLLASGLAIRVACIPAPHDPDSYVKAHGPDAFRQLLHSAPDFFEFYLDHLAQQHNPAADRGRLAITRAMGQALAKTRNAVLIDTYAQKTANRLAVASDAVRAEFRKAVQTSQTAPSAPVPHDDASEPTTLPVTSTRPGTQEFWLLKLLLLDDTLIDWASRRLDLAWIQHPGVRRILEARFAAQAHGNPDIAALVGNLEHDPDRSLASEAVAERRDIPNRAQQVADLLRRLRDQHLDRELAQLTREVSRNDLSDTERANCLRRQVALRDLKRQPLIGPCDDRPLRS